MPYWVQSRVVSSAAGPFILWFLANCETIAKPQGIDPGLVTYQVSQCIETVAVIALLDRLNPLIIAACGQSVQTMLPQSLC